LFFNHEKGDLTNTEESLKQKVAKKNPPGPFCTFLCKTSWRDGKEEENNTLNDQINLKLNLFRSECGF